MAKELPLVYIAGPYTRPDPVLNTNNTIKEADALYLAGLCTPVIPHLTLLWHMVIPHDLNFWYDYDIRIMRRCDAVLRLAGASTGADNEIAEARRLEIPVFLDSEGERDNLVAWCKARI